MGVYGAFRLPEVGLWSAATLVCAVATVALGALAAVLERRAEHPLVHAGLLHDRLVVGANLATLAASISMLGLLYFFNLFAQSAAALDRTGVAVAVVLIPFTLAMLVFAHLSGFLTRRMGYRGPVLVGLGLAVVGFAWLGTTAPGTSELSLVVPLALCGVGAGIANAGLTVPAVLVEPRARLDEAAGLVSLTRFVGAALAIALGTSTYLAAARHLPPSQLAAAGVTVEHAAVGGSVFQRAVATLDDDLRGPFEAASQEHTAEGFASTMRLTGMLVGVLTAISAWLLRPRRGAPRRARRPGTGGPGGSPGGPAGGPVGVGAASDGRRGATG